MVDYFDLHPVVSLILLIIPFTCWICGLITRCKEGCYVAAILRFFFGCWILWVIEIVLTIMNGCKVKLLKVVNC